MRARDVIGKRIVAVRQQRVWNDHLGQFIDDLAAIELEGGREIRVLAVETETEPLIASYVV